jgi:hypothetical protein
VQAKFLRYLDLSENNLDKKAVEWLVQSLVPSSSSPTTLADKSPPPLIDFDSPRPENGDARREEDSERVNGETHEEGIVEEEDQRELEPLFEVAPLLREEKDSEVGSVLSLRLENCGLRGQALEVLGKSNRLLCSRLNVAGTDGSDP